MPFRAASVAVTLEYTYSCTPRPGSAPCGHDERPSEAEALAPLLWTAQGDRGRIDAANLAYIGRVQVQLIAALVIAVLAGVFRARWTVLAHLLVALLAVLVIAQHQWDGSHTPPGCIRYDAHC
ncbi:hypothetical protein T261_8069 [Streptomyces lydicus]|nr:hypothetical protein T261_8069 [Streptomyces lydicus]